MSKTWIRHILQNQQNPNGNTKENQSKEEEKSSKSKRMANRTNIIIDYDY